MSVLWAGLGVESHDSSHQTTEGHGRSSGVKPGAAMARPEEPRSSSRLETTKTGSSVPPEETIYQATEMISSGRFGHLTPPNGIPWI